MSSTTREDQASGASPEPSRRRVLQAAAPVFENRLPPMARLRKAIVEDVRPLRLRLRVANALLFFCPNYALSRLRTQIYRLIGFRIGRNAMVLGSLQVAGEGDIWGKLIVGEYALLNAPLYLDLSERIEIGSHAVIGNHTLLITSDHRTDGWYRRCGRVIARPITVGDGAWIAAGCTILPGVTIGEGAVVAAGAVVSRDVAPHTLVGGVPARFIKQLPVADAE
jgi:maltose O-acetyltransferase